MELWRFILRKKHRKYTGYTFFLRKNIKRQVHAIITFVLNHYLYKQLLQFHTISHTKTAASIKIKHKKLSYREVTVYLIKKNVGPFCGVNFLGILENHWTLYFSTKTKIKTKTVNNLICTPFTMGYVFCRMHHCMLTEIIFRFSHFNLIKLNLFNVLYFQIFFR